MFKPNIGSPQRSREWKRIWSTAERGNRIAEEIYRDAHKNMMRKEMNCCYLLYVIY